MTGLWAPSRWRFIFVEVWVGSPDFPITHRFWWHGTLPPCCAAKVHQEATNHLTRQRPRWKAALRNPKFGVRSLLGVRRLLEPAEYVLQ